MRKKKIIVVMPTIGRGGAERVMVNLINFLDKDKYEITIVIFEDKRFLETELNSRINIVCLGKKSKWDFIKMIVRFRILLTHIKPDVVVSAIYYANIIASIARFGFESKIRLIVCEHSYPREYLPKVRLGFIKKWLIKQTYKKTDKVVAVSKGIAEVMEQDFKIDSDKIKTIYNPIPLDAIRSKTKETISHPFFEDSESKVIISTGRLVKSKRIDILLRSFSKIRTMNKYVNLIILGRGELLQELTQLAQALEVSDWVDFVGFQKNPYAWLHRSDIFVLSSDYEGFPLSIIEAMACGIPVVSTDCPSGPGEIIASGKNGILIPRGDDEALASGILSLIENDSLKNKMVTSAESIVQKFNPENIVPLYEDIFDGTTKK